MTQATTVTLNEHANGTFDVIYCNPKSGAVSESEKDFWVHLITAVISGVSSQLHLNSYRDPTDRAKAVSFIDVLTIVFPALAFLKTDSIGGRTPAFRSMGELSMMIRGLSDEDLIALAHVLETIHVSGSIVGKENPEEMSGLVTITYCFLEDKASESRKVRLSGKQIVEVGMALAAPYIAAKESGALVISKPKIDETKIKPASVEEKKAETTVGEIRLAKDQLEQLANMVTERLLFAMNKQGQGMRPKPQQQKRVIAHAVKDRIDSKMPRQSQTQ